jgi:DNA-binding IclR family transcriptional regulator
VIALQGPQRLADLARLMAAPRRGIQRLLVSLEQAGLVSRDPETRRYDLGMALAVLGAIAAERMDLARLAPPHLRQVLENTGQTGFLLSRQGPEAVCANLQLPADGPTLVLPLGRAIPLWQGAVRVILAYLDDDQVRAVVPRDRLPGVRPRLNMIRARGWEEGHAEVLPGAVAVTAPVFDPVGEPIGCVGALGYEAHLDTGACVGPVRAAAASLTAALGGRAPGEV